MRLLRLWGASGDCRMIEKLLLHYRVRRLVLLPESSWFIQVYEDQESCRAV